MTTSPPKALEACPFCNDMPAIHQSNGWWRVECDCGAEACHSKDRDQSVAEWNSRPLEQKLREELAAVREQRDGFANLAHKKQGELLDYAERVGQLVEERDQLRAQLAEALSVLERAHCCATYSADTQEC